MTHVDRPVIVDSRADPDAAIGVAVAELESGHVVGLATDTVYGLAARVDDPLAIREIYELKGRPTDRRMAILVADVDQAGGLVELTEAARRLASRFWPGPLTIVAKRMPGVLTEAGDESSLGVRCPADRVVRALTAHVGAVAATSANRHGCPPATDAAGVAEAFPSLGMVIDGGERTGGASTVVSVMDDELVVVREGPISGTRLREALGSR